MAATPILALPYPVGTDRVADGDNAIQALAERIEALKFPRGWLGNVALNAPQAGIGISGDIVGLTVALAALPANRRIRISAMVGFTSAGATRVDFYIMEGATVLDSQSASILAGGAFLVMSTWTILTPVAGAHTYKVAAGSSAGTISTTAGAAAGHPSLLVEDIGQV